MNESRMANRRGASGAIDLDVRAPQRYRALRRQPAQLRGRQRVSDVLDATERLVSQRHFDLITMDEIAKEAEIQIGSLYHFFEDKTSVLISVLERALEAEADAFRAAPEDASRSLLDYLHGLEARQRQLWKARPAVLDLYFAYQRHPRIWAWVLENRARVSRDIAAKMSSLYPALKSTAALEVGEQVGITISVLNDNLAYLDKSAQRRLRRECFEMLVAYVESKAARSLTRASRVSGR